MRFLTIALLILSTFPACLAQEDTFSEASLNDVFKTVDGEPITFKTILKNNEGRPVLLDIWASWCRDCVIAMPKVKKIAKQHPDVSIMYLSLDKTEKSWKKGIDRFKLREGEHYWAPKGWESVFFDAIDLDWIPRYMVIDKKGKIRLFKAIKATDKKIEEKLITVRNEK